MKHGGKVAICLAGGLALQTGARAVTADSTGNPYAGIVDRNVFALKPAPPPPDPPPRQDQLPQKIVLTGIVNAFGKKQVFFKTPMAKPGEAPKETSYMLSEGERAGEIEILEINAIEHTVRVKNHGQEQSLSLEKDGMKPQGGTGAGPGALPAVPGMVVPGMGVQSGASGASLTPVPNFGAGGATTIKRSLRVPAESVGGPQGYVAPPGFSASPGFAASPGANALAQPKALSPEEQIVHMEINRKLTAEEVAKGEMPPLPPTPFTPDPSPQ